MCNMTESEIGDRILTANLECAYTRYLAQSNEASVIYKLTDAEGYIPLFPRWWRSPNPLVVWRRRVTHARFVEFVRRSGFICLTSPRLVPTS